MENQALHVCSLFKLKLLVNEFKTLKKHTFFSLNRVCHTKKFTVGSKSVEGDP